MKPLVRAVLYICLFIAIAWATRSCEVPGRMTPRVPDGITQLMTAVPAPQEEAMAGEGEFLGLVQGGQLRLLAPAPAGAGPVRLTAIQIQEARSPESAELDLAGLEGLAIMVRGHLDSGWIYSAELIDQAGPILTAVVRQVFCELD